MGTECQLGKMESSGDDGGDRCKTTNALDVTELCT